MWFQLTIINNNDLLRDHMDGLVNLFKTESYFVLFEGIRNGGSKGIHIKLYNFHTVKLFI
jgi:hypothetical protein